MNINVTLGVISFVIWSTFSTWFYVNFIKDFERVPIEELADRYALLPTALETAANNDPPIPAVVPPVPFQISRNFTFYKNTTNLIHPVAIQQFVDSLQAALKDRTVSISVIGNTCDLGKENYNYNLGLERAEYVVKALKTSSNTWPEITISSQGESNPQAPNTSELNRIKNRRVSILITSTP